MALNQNRAKDRMTMATRLREIAEKHGFTAEIEERREQREVHVVIRTKRGLSMSTHLEAGPCSDFFLGHWFMDTDSDAKLAMSFGADCNGSVNPYHQRKATTDGGGADDFEVFAGIVDRCLEAIRSDVVFEEKEPGL